MSKLKLMYIARVVIIGLLVVSTYGCKAPWGSHESAQLPNSNIVDDFEPPQEFGDGPGAFQLPPEPPDETSKTSPAPEPATLLLLGPALLGLFGLKRKRA